MKVSRIRKGILFAILVSGFGLGCELIVDFDRTRIPVEGTDGATPTPEASTDAPVDAPADSSDAETGTACNTLAYVQPAVAITGAFDAAPPPTGGTLAAGSYALTGVTEYNAVDAGPTGTSYRALVALTGTAYDSIQTLTASDGGVISDLRDKGTYATTGTGDASTVTQTRTCPSAQTITYGYSVLDGGAVIHLYAPTPTTVQVFTKQP
jgi:hypothetical protein